MAGYVARVSKALSEAGYLPVVIDNLSTGHENFVRWVRSFEPTLKMPTHSRRH